MPYVCVCARASRIQTRSTSISLIPHCFTDTKVSCRMCECARARLEYKHAPRLFFWFLFVLQTPKSHAMCVCLCVRASRIQTRCTSISLIPPCFTDTKVSCRIVPLSTDTKVELRSGVGVRMKNSIRNRNGTGGARTEAARDVATSRKHAHRLKFFFSNRMLNRERERARQRRLSRVLKLSDVFTF